MAAAVAELLLAARADVNAMGQDGETPLDIAVRSENLAAADAIRAWMRALQPGDAPSP